MHSLTGLDPVDSKVVVGDHYKLPRDPALSRTCKQIRRETLPVYYGGNVFLWLPKFEVPIIPGSLMQLTPDKRGMLETVNVFCFTPWARANLGITVWVEFVMLREDLREMGVHVKPGVLRVSVMGTDGRRVWVREPLTADGDAGEA